MTITQTETDIDPITGEPRATHIIIPIDERNAVALVIEARIYGFAVETLCGIKFVPQYDPKQYPLCSRCKEIREGARPDQDPSNIPY